MLCGQHKATIRQQIYSVHEDHDAFLLVYSYMCMHCSHFLQLEMQRLSVIKTHILCGLRRGINANSLVDFDYLTFTTMLLIL